MIDNESNEYKYKCINCMELVKIDCPGLSEFIIKMKMKKPSSSFNNFLALSIVVNVISILVVFFMLYQYRKLKKRAENKSAAKNYHELDPSSNHKETEQDKTVTIQTNLYQKGDIAIANDSTQTDKMRARLLSESDCKENPPQKLEPNQKARQKDTIEASLKEQLQLEQQRNKYLEEKIYKMEQDLRLSQSMNQEQDKTNNVPHQQTGDVSQMREELSNLKNQLDFCQKKLAQSYDTERELKEQIQIYEKMGGSSFDYGQISRLRQMNLRYKEIIRNMQSCLIEGQPKNMYFSFVEDDRS